MSIGWAKWTISHLYNFTYLNHFVFYYSFYSFFFHFIRKLFIYITHWLLYVYGAPCAILHYSWMNGCDIDFIWQWFIYLIKLSALNFLQTFFTISLRFIHNFKIFNYSIWIGSDPVNNAEKCIDIFGSHSIIQLNFVPGRPFQILMFHTPFFVAP